jgi:nucleotide-binding universal stress UspA family protein
MTISHILWPTDFSTLSRNAAPVVNEMARRFSAPVEVLNVVVDPPMIAPRAALALESYKQVSEEHAVTALDNLVRDDVAEDVVAHTHTVRATATAHAIVDFADAQGIDLIIISTHGETGLTRLVFGSVAEKVVRMARCLVLTVPIPPDEE